MDFFGYFLLGLFAAILTILVVYFVAKVVFMAYFSTKEYYRERFLKEMRRKQNGIVKNEGTSGRKESR